MRHLWFFPIGLGFASALACSDDAAIEAANAGGSSGTAGSSAGGGANGSGGSGGTSAGGTAGGGSPSAGGSAASTGTGGNAGVSSNGGSTSTSPISPFDGFVRKPDVVLTPVSDCQGQMDLTPCTLVTTPDRAYDVCALGMCSSPGCGDESCNVTGPHFMMPPVFDHHYFEREPGDEPVVVDLVTGLGWQGCLAGLHGDDCAQGAATQSAWEDAFTYCDNLTWGGKDDWYLPDPYETASLYTLDDSGYRDATRFPNANGPFWTNGSIGGGSPWRQGSLLYQVYSGDTATVRCVRRGSSTPPDLRRFKRWAPATGTPAEFIVRDVATGLDWQSCDNCNVDGSATPLVYPDAVAYCDNLSWAGYSDWRLPTAKEHLTTQNLRDTGITLGFFTPFHREGPYVQAWSGDPAQNPSPDVYDDEAGFTGPYPGKGYPAICARWSGTGP
jgi:Protein of unknown function (DUF1566)